MIKSSSAKARKIARIVFKAAKDYLNAHLYFGRKFDSLLENGDGEEVVVEFIKLYNNNKKLQKATKRVNRYINIESWLNTYKRWESKYPSLDI